MTKLNLIKVKTTDMINPNLRVVFLPVFSLFLLLILVFPVFNYGYQKIAEQNQTYKEKEGQIAKLETKLDILREVQDSVLDSMDTSLLAVPSVNPSLWKMFQIYQMSNEVSVVMNKRSARAETKQVKGLSSTELSFNVSGDFNSLMQFLENMNQYVPLFTIDNVGIKGGKGAYEVSVNITTYRAALPTQLPALTQPIKRLSEDDQELIQKLSEMKPPEFTTLSPMQPSNRESPFR